LRSKIESSLKEMLASPAEAVLPAFLDVKASGTKPTVSAEQKEFIEIKQELELLRREMRSREETGRRIIGPRERIIGPREARSMVRSMVQQGIPDVAIINRMEGLLTPREWVESVLAEISSPPIDKPPPTELPS
jgi:hypothetical protein